MIIKFAIATVSHYMEKTLPILIDSLLKNGIDRDNIHVFVNDSDCNKDEILDDIHYHYNKGLSYFEWICPKLILERNLKSDWWFLLHDTVKFGPGMKEKLYTTLENNHSINIIKLTPHHSNSIGMLRQSIFDNHLEFFSDKLNQLDTFTDMIERKIWCIQNENQYLHIETFSYFQPDEVKHQPSQTQYGVNRLVEYFYGIDMYKFKKNGHGYAAVTDVNL
jgi:hypothetical protein